MVVEMAESEMAFNDKPSNPNSPRNGCSTVTISQKEKDTLLHLEPLKKMIECALISPYIEGEKPLSLLIIAKAESGKTSAMKLYRENKGVVYITDCTAYGLTRDILPKMVSKEIRTLMIPDLLTPLSKPHKTRQAFIAFLNNLTEEGIAKVTTYAMVWDKDVKANVMAAVTEQALRDGRHEWAKMGFFIKVYCFSYSYSFSTVMEILNSYSEHGLSIDNVKLELPEKDVDIELPKEIADRLNPIAVKIGEQL